MTNSFGKIDYKSFFLPTLYLKVSDGYCKVWKIGPTNRIVVFLIFCDKKHKSKEKLSIWMSYKKVKVNFFSGENIEKQCFGV